MPWFNDWYCYQNAITLMKFMMNEGNEEMIYHNLRYTHISTFNSYTEKVRSYVSLDIQLYADYFTIMLTKFQSNSKLL